ncbi:hypothetical protein V6Z11_A11G349900 [Gossypium hirsutum]
MQRKKGRNQNGCKVFSKWLTREEELTVTYRSMKVCSKYHGSEGPTKVIKLEWKRSLAIIGSLKILGN